MTATLDYTLGSIVTCRDRQWVVLPSENEDIVCLRPLSGNEEEIVGIYRQLALDAVASATFPLPKATSIKDSASALLLMEGAVRSSWVWSKVVGCSVKL